MPMCIMRPISRMERIPVVLDTEAYVALKSLAGEFATPPAAVTAAAPSL